MKQFVVDTFTDKVFAGNPAAVCLIENWIDEETLLQIARENNLSETAFAVRQDLGNYHLRWFTPGGEIDLCGHATLATAFVIMNIYSRELETVDFQTLSGRLTVRKAEDWYQLSLPTYKLEEIPVSEEMTDALGLTPRQAFMGRDLLCILDKEDEVRMLQPNLKKLKALKGLLLHVSAPGTDYDCVSRSFAPKLQIDEDPVCGSGHCHIIPYWAERLGKTDLTALQASARSGVLRCQLLDSKQVILSGQAILYSEASLFLQSL